MTLADLHPGTRATIAGYERADVSPRLLEMGLLPGVHVEVVRRAPLGDPIYVHVMGHPLSLRLHDARAVLVERR